MFCLPLGPVIGPMMICGYLIDENNLEKLKEYGVRDSKQLTPEKRKRLLPKLKRLADDYILLKVSAREIDELRDTVNLNKIEIAKMQEIINLLKPDRVIIDSPEVNTKKFKEKIAPRVIHKGVEIVCENFADKKYLEVGAASIIAKVHRDKEIEKLHDKYGFFGSGYTSDERTIKFLKDWIKMNKEFPVIVRKSWTTAMVLKEEVEQKKIMEFLNENDEKRPD